MSWGKLTGVGVGPGAPDLLTFRAVDVVRRADVIAIPRSSEFSASVALQIIEPHIADLDGQVRLYVTTPMFHDADKVAAAWQKAGTSIEAHLRRGCHVAFIAEGDPMVFSSFIYLLRHAHRNWPEVAIDIVPGVSSITAVPAVTQLPLADGQERIAIVPAAYDIEELPAILDRFDTIVMMKIGPAMDAVLGMLEERNLLQNTIYVSHATMRSERVVRDLATSPIDKAGCFSMLITAKRIRNGFLLGESPRGPIPTAAIRGIGS